MRSQLFVTLALLSSAVAVSQSPATITVDLDGIPHIRGESILQVAYASGRQQMMDFPIITAFALASSTGTLAEAVGEGPLGVFVDLGYGVEQQVGLWFALDVEFHQWRIQDIADRHLSNMSPEVIQVLTSFAEGLEYQRQLWMSSGGWANLMTESWPMPVQDNPSGGVVYLDATAIQNLLSRPIDFMTVLLRGTMWSVGGAQNAARLCAVSGNCTPVATPNGSNVGMVKTATTGGHRLLWGDPHGAIEEGAANFAPFRSFWHTLQAGSGFHVGGYTSPGFFGCVMGFNENLAWGYTAAAPDTVDVWRAPLVSGQIPAGGVASSIIRLQVTVRKFTSSGLVNVPITLGYVLDQGGVQYPIVRERPDQIYWAGSGSMASRRSFLEFLYRLNSASSITDGQDAVTLGESFSVLPAGNMCMISKDGDMRYWYMGHVPARTSGPSKPQGHYQQVLDGMDPTNAWPSANMEPVLHPLTYLPMVTASPSDPPMAWVNNNSHPVFVAPPGSGFSPTPSPPTAWEHVAQDGVLNNGLPPWPAYQTLRNKRAHALLAVPSSVTPTTFEQVAMDVYDNWSAKYLPCFAAAMPRFRAKYYPTGPLPPAYNSVWAALNTWDKKALKESGPAAIAWLLRHIHWHWNHTLQYPNMHKKLFNGHNDWPVDPTVLLTPAYSGDLEVMADAFNQLLAVYGQVANYSGSASPFLPAFPSLVQGDPPWRLPTEPASPDWADAGWFGPNQPAFANNNPLVIPGATGLSLGHMKFMITSKDQLNLSNLNNIGIYPTDGMADSLFCNYDQFPALISGTMPGSTLPPAPPATFLAVERNSGGSSQTYIVELTPTGPIAKYVAAVGFTEFHRSPRRYLSSPHYSSRTPRRLWFTSAEIDANTKVGLTFVSNY
jgi:hypothetical protein